MVWSLALLVGLLALLGLSAAYQELANRRDRRTFPPPDELVEVNGHRLHYQVMGEGNPTVVVDSGQGATHLDWQLVQPEVAQFTQILTYDRAGYGWSELSLVWSRLGKPAVINHFLISSRCPVFY